MKERCGVNEHANIVLKIYFVFNKKIGKNITKKNKYLEKKNTSNV